MTNPEGLSAAESDLKDAVARYVPLYLALRTRGQFEVREVRLINAPEGWHILTILVERQDKQPADESNKWERVI